MPRVSSVKSQKHRSADAELTSVANREPVGSCNLRQTTLDACVNLQSSNADYIDNIASRISALIGRLRGYSTKGECGGEGEREHEGVLGNLRSDLEDEGVRLGEIQADLAVLEELL